MYNIFKQSEKSKNKMDHFIFTIIFDNENIEFFLHDIIKDLNYKIYYIQENQNDKFANIISEDRITKLRNDKMPIYLRHHPDGYIGEGFLIIGNNFIQLSRFYQYNLKNSKVAIENEHNIISYILNNFINSVSAWDIETEHFICDYPNIIYAFGCDGNSMLKYLNKECLTVEYGY